MIKDLEITKQGAAAVRFIVGRFGSGKTFFLNLIRNVAFQQGFAVVQADITTGRRLQGTDGQARAFFAELMRNLATRAHPEGGALQSLVERWVGDVNCSVRDNGGIVEDVKEALAKALRPLLDFVNGFDFTTVLTRYYEGFLEDDEAIQDSALRWLRGEYSTKTEAIRALSVRNIIDDNSFYDYLKLFAAFVRIAGYAGLLVNIDELVAISHGLSNSVARKRNYEAILQIINDCFQGHAQGIIFVFAGTDECVDDLRRGLFSHEALATRLAPNRFAGDGHRDLSSPVIRLQNLTREECFVLLSNVRHVHAAGDQAKYLISDNEIKSYLKQCSDRMGAVSFQTPRDTVKDFVGLLNVLDQDKSVSFKSLMDASKRRKTEVAPLAPGVTRPSDDLTEFRL